MKLIFGFGNGTQEVDLPEKNLLGELHASLPEGGLRGEAEVRRALEHPIGTPRLREIVRPGESIAIVTSDVTRPMPTAKVLPLVLDELYAAGCRAQDITLVFALGSHRPQTREEQERLAGERAVREIRLEDSDPNDCIHLGTTSRGTPVDITRRVAEADRVICLGNLEYHYFAGYSGGAKALLPGCSTPHVIQANHSMMVRPEAHAGALAGNPVREDIEEAEHFRPIDFILNVVLDEHKEIVKAVAGDVTKAHREGCRFLDELYLKKIPQAADIVIASQGGAPKDLNLYQTQKALDNAARAVRPGGIVILIGSCREGLGQKVMERWFKEAPTAHSMVERVQAHFELGGHKAAAIAMVLEKADIFLVSELDPDFVRGIFLTPQLSAQAALDEAFRRLGLDATVLSMPYGGSTLPVVTQQNEI